MNPKLHPVIAHLPVRAALRLLLAGLASALALAAGGCASPVFGPTDPKEFIVQRREWNPSTTPPIEPAAAQPATP
jgi:hypothetical protein